MSLPRPGLAADDARATWALGEALGVSVPPATVRAVFEALPVRLTEWSVNAADDPRARLRFGAWTADLPAVDGVLTALGEVACRACRARLPSPELEGLGFAYAGDPRLRWWQLAPAADGSALARAIPRAAPELAEDAARLEAICGGPARCTGFGWEGVGGQPLRTTIYYTVLTPERLRPLLAHIGPAVTADSEVFFRLFLGLHPRSPRAWPKLWIGRSVGRGGGWKLYWFVRGEPGRPTDRAILTALGAGPQLWQSWSHACAILGSEAVIQLVGLTFRDSALPTAPPDWTIYFARR